MKKIKAFCWFCQDFHEEIMILVSTCSKNSDEYEAEIEEMTLKNNELSSFIAVSGALDMKRKVDIFDGVTLCPRSKIQNFQETVQNVERGVKQKLDRQTAGLESNGILKCRQKNTPRTLNNFFPQLESENVCGSQ